MWGRFRLRAKWHPKLSATWAKDIHQSVECAPSPMGICGEEIQGERPTLRSAAPRRHDQDGRYSSKWSLRSIDSALRFGSAVPLSYDREFPPSSRYGERFWAHGGPLPCLARSEHAAACPYPGAIQWWKGSVQYDQLHEAQLQGCFVVGKKRACAGVDWAWFCQPSSSRHNEKYQASSQR